MYRYVAYETVGLSSCRTIELSDYQSDPLMEVPTSTKGHNSVITKNLCILKAMQNLLQIIHKEREALSTGTCICIDSPTLFFYQKSLRIGILMFDQCDSQKSLYILTFC